MAYIHLNMDKLVMIESYYHQGILDAKVAEYLDCTRTPIYKVIAFLEASHTALDYYLRYKENKKKCVRRKIVLPQKKQIYIKEEIA